VKNGEILFENVGRRFRVYPKRNMTLKEAVVRRRDLKPTDIWALRDVTLHVEPGKSIGFVGRNGSGKTTLLRLIAGIFGPTTGRVEVGGSVGSLLELGAGFHPDFTGRENIYLSGSIYGLKRRTINERLEEIVAFAELDRFIDFPVRTYSAGMQMRLGFAIAVHVQAEVLLLDEVFAVGDEAFQRKCFAKIFDFKRNGGTIVFVSHDAAAVERLCERAILLRQGCVTFDGATHDALTEYHRLLADEREPAESIAGLDEWGSGEARIATARVCGRGGEQRDQFLSGEPLSLQLELVAGRAVPPPRLSFELRDDAGRILASGDVETAELGWPDEPGDLLLRFDVDALPLADGRFHFALALDGGEGGQLYHRLARVAAFVVYPAGGERGAVLLNGRWSAGEVPAAAELKRS
jgi:ABC-type polysaccharide/polyol phosphate transport system ATPase subunit